ncbi:MAG TPA: hypothetical protein VLV83_11425 [Acidobacteriota bacterium]|nr:hypothetical protein [Acidobacteriota bacterium]
MAEGTETLFVNPSLNGFTLSRLLQQPSRISSLQAVSPEETDAEAEQPLTELPFSAAGTLEEGTLYPPSEGHAPVRFYIPSYGLRLQGGRHTSSLRLESGGDDDPNAPFGRLEVELVAQAPVDQTFVLREMDHEAVARIHYRLPVDSGDGSSAGSSDSPQALLGEWVNVDSATRGMTRLLIVEDENGRLQFHGFGRCSPRECDWGLTPARPQNDGTLVGTYDFGFKKTRISARPSGEQLLAEVFDDYAEGDRRSDRTTNYVLRRTTPPPQTESAELTLELGPLEPVGDNISRVTRDLLSEQEYQRVFQIMTQQVHEARLEVEVTATVGRRTWRQVIPSLVSARPALDNVLLREIESVVVQPRTAPAPSPPPAPSPAAPAPTAAPSRVSHASPASPVFMVNQPRAVAVNRPAVAHLSAAQPANALERENAAVAPVLAAQPLAAQPVAAARQPNLTVAQPLSFTINGTDVSGGNRVNNVVHDLQLADGLFDLPIFSDIMVNRPVLSRRIFVDRDGAPAVVRTQVNDTQDVGSFHFPLPAHRYMFDMLEDPAPQQSLVRQAVTVGDQTVNFYRDTGIPGQVYYEPTEFRLIRHDTDPYAPSILFGFLEVAETVTEGSAGAATEGSSRDAYRVLLSFLAEAYNDPSILQQARLEFGEDASFSALQPQAAALRLNLPVGQDGDLMDVERPEAEISFQTGLQDEVELSQDEFIQILNSLQGPAAQVDGVVEATLIDGSTAEIPVILSLSENGGSLFHRGPSIPVEGQDGIYRVRLTNRLESDVRVVGLPSIRLGSDARAAAITPALPVTVEAGGSIDVDYQLTPQDFPLTDLDPLVEAEILPDHARIFQIVSVNQGYASDTFDVQISADAALFGSVPEGESQPLTGLRVEIQPNVVVELEAQDNEKTASLRMPLLPFLLQEDAKQFTYRVINITDEGDGLVSPFETRLGDTPLRVSPAQPQSDPTNDEDEE